MNSVKHIVLLDDDSLNSYFVKTHLRHFFRREPFVFTYFSRPTEFIDYLHYMDEHGIMPDIILIDFYLKAFNVESIFSILDNEFSHYKDKCYIFSSADKAKNYTFKVLDKSKINDLNSLLIA